MTVALYVDHHVKRSITSGLRLRGVDVLTCAEDGTTMLPDPELLDRASGLGRVLFSQDADLLREGTRRQIAGIPFAGVIYARQSWVSIGVCIRDLEIIAKASELDDLRNQVTHLPL